MSRLKATRLEQMVTQSLSPSISTEHDLTQPTNTPHDLPKHDLPKQGIKLPETPKRGLSNPIQPCSRIGLSLSQICQPTSEDIKQQTEPSFAALSAAAWSPYDGCGQTLLQHPSCTLAGNLRSSSEQGGAIRSAFRHSTPVTTLGLVRCICGNGEAKKNGEEREITGICKVDGRRSRRRARGG